ncbi:MAG TPA: hypothetical protein VHZ28_18740 [Terracidiphilus sp.]|jgi:heme/copper-type cytochrome/quinol oxidase subunit 2|nr:hypothetical protein [Terracidiphilus sp.]
MRSLVLISVVCLAAGVTILFAYCSGTTSMNAAYPFSGTSVHVDITTSGIPAVLGIPLTIGGAVLLIVAWFAALFRRKTEPADEAPLERGNRPKI